MEGRVKCHLPVCPSTGGCRSSPPVAGGGPSGLVSELKTVREGPCPVLAAKEGTVASGRSNSTRLLSYSRISAGFCKHDQSWTVGKRGASRLHRKCFCYLDS